jgi:peptidoglycan/LPS O-acetylase OafA/YrhL
MVLIAHAKNIVVWQPSGVLKSVWDRVGVLGVNIFFGLSGYLITRLLVEEFRQKGEISFRNFYVRRSLRIIPAFYIYLGVITALVFWRVLQIPHSQLVRAALFLTNYFRCYETPDFWYVGHTWVLAVEAQFYVFWPVLLDLA